MSMTWWRPVPFVLACFGWLLAWLVSTCQWIWHRNGGLLCCGSTSQSKDGCQQREEEGRRGEKKGEDGGGGGAEKRWKMSKRVAAKHRVAEEGPGVPLLLHYSPPVSRLLSEEKFAQLPAVVSGVGCPAERRSPSNGNFQSETAATRSLERNAQFGLTCSETTKNSRNEWQQTSRIATTKETMAPRETTNLDSPGVALLACPSGTSSVQLASAPHRFVNFLSRRLKRTKSHPKLQQQHQRERNVGEAVKGGKQQLMAAIRASLTPNTLSTDLQHQSAQRNNQQPLSLYLPGGGGFHKFAVSALANEQNMLKTSRSFESLLLLGKFPPYAQKSPSESQRLLLSPAVDVPSLQSSMVLNRSGGGGRACWMESSASCSSLPATRGMQPNRDDRRRVENSLSVWVLEAKGVPPKRRFFCELSLDRVVKARTSAKAMADGTCFWGEQFDFNQLPPSHLLCIDLFREAEPTKKRRSGKSSHEDLQNLIGLIRIPVTELSARQPTEKWYSITSGDGGQSAMALVANNNGDVQSPTVRLKARYQSVHILPLCAYSPLRDFLRSNFLHLCTTFEPILGVKAKEDFANALVRILNIERTAPEALTELVMAEVLGQENDHLLFRGNSLATKAVEAYMKLVATDYLQMTLGEFVRQLLCNELSCEVDPLRLSSSSSSSGPSSISSSILEKNRQHLMRQVESVWRRILACQDFFPYPLRLLFASLRQKLDQAGRAELADNLLSSSIFLRFLCPAILSPSLFGLVSEFPTGQAARNLTLIAKSLQTLANFTRFGGKEGYMEFMNAFVEREWRHMHQFLCQISAPCPRHCQAGELQSTAIDMQIDLGKELSLLNSYLRENWTNHLQERDPQNGQLWAILVALSAWDICDQTDEQREGEYEIEGENEDDNDRERSGCHGWHNNPPSDYENNSTQIFDQPRQKTQSSQECGTTRNPADDHKYQQSLLPNRRAVLPLPLTPPPPTTALVAAHHLHSSDDYVHSSALAKLRARGEPQKSSPGSSIIHLYDQTPPTTVHLYDEVASSSGKAMASGIVTAQRGMASQETQRRELYTPKMVQRGRTRQVEGITGADEADDESESEDGEREEKDRTEYGLRESQQQKKNNKSSKSSAGTHSNCATGGPFFRRVPRKYSSQTACHQYGAIPQDFDSSCASAISGEGTHPQPTAGVYNNPTTGIITGRGGGFQHHRHIPSSGYHSQLNSSSTGNSSSTPSNSSSPVDTIPSGHCSHLGTTVCQSRTNQTQMVAAAIPSITSPDAVLPPHCQHQNPSADSSPSSSSAYSSLSPNQQQSNEGHAIIHSGFQIKIGQQRPSSNHPERAAQTTAAIVDTENRGRAEKNERAFTGGGIPGKKNTLQGTPKPWNPSCWSIPGSSVHPSRHAFISSNPDDPLGAFIRYPASSGVVLPQKFPTTAELQHWPDDTHHHQQQSQRTNIYNCGVVQPYSSNADFMPNWHDQRRESNSSSSNNKSRMVPPITLQQQQILGEMELIETQRRQIVELTKENAALKRELDTVRANSSSCGEHTASESV